MRISILEQSPLSEGEPAQKAIQDSVRLAEVADDLGYNRIWLSEHHNMPVLQGSSPELLLAAIGARTRHIRLGSGGVMLPNHNALKVAENFRVLESLYPGRIDCGVGRASGGDPASFGLLGPATAIDFPDQLKQLQRFLADEDPKVTAVPGVTTVPPMWLLSAGSHPDSGRLAAHRGMGLALALFINPNATVEAVRQYRRAFRPSATMSEPKVLIALNFVTADHPGHLNRLKKASDYFRLMRDGGTYAQAVPSAATLDRIAFSYEQEAYLARIANREVTGLPEEVARKIHARATAFGADEVMLSMMAFDIADKLDAFRLVADALVGERA